MRPFIGAWAIIAALGAQTEPPGSLLARAGDYVAQFEVAFSNVVSEERYTQDFIARGRTAVSGPGIRHREMRSDFLLVLMPEPTGWVPFRDVFEVDGKPVRDREDRLTTLFRQFDANAAERAADITEESARYNIGIVRTVNHPLLALQVLRPTNQHRFRFSDSKPDPTAGENAVLIEYTEQVRPSLIRGPQDRDMMMHGRLWIDGRDGTLLKTEVNVDTLAVSASIATRYGKDPGFPTAVPVEMTESYTEINGRRLTATATYGHFRRFDIAVAEKRDK